MYVATGLGVTVGFHRMLTHRSFATYKPVQYLFAILGSMAVQGPVISWVADHRKHHAHTDEEGDPHSPHGHGSGFKGAVKGLWYAHMGWLFDRQGQAAYASTRATSSRTRASAASTRCSRSGSRSASRSRPASAGDRRARSPARVTGALWGGAVRIFLLHHVTWSINSVCHFFGTRRFEVDDHSTNVFWLAPLSFGESWHHNHHAFPRSAMHGLRWWEVDPTAWVIRGDEGDQAGLERRRDQPGAPGAEARAASGPRSPRPPKGGSAVPSPRAAPDNPYGVSPRAGDLRGLLRQRRGDRRLGRPDPVRPGALRPRQEHARPDPADDVDRRDRRPAGDGPGDRAARQRPRRAAGRDALLPDGAAAAAGARALPAAARAARLRRRGRRRWTSR